MAIVRITDWAPCRACTGQLELRVNGEVLSDGHWVHVSGDGDYVYNDHHPEPGR
jgi:hypothetical protein